VLQGRIQEANAGPLARSLEAQGVVVEGVREVGDDAAAIGGAVEELLGRVDLLVVSGGLGPTHDDVTMSAVASALGRRMELRDEVLAMVRDRQAGIVGAPTPSREAAARKQAALPEGATVLPPPGTAPGCILEEGGRLVVVLPGPPWELAAMWAAALAVPPLRDLVERAPPLSERTLRAYRTLEAQLVPIVDAIPPDVREGLEVGICARDAELEITLRSSPEAAPAAGRLEEELARELGPALYSRDGRGVDEIVAEALIARRETVATAESCTGGGLGARLTSRPGSSAYVLGGVIAYANEVKRDVLGISEETLRLHGAVSAECAREMATGALRAIGSDWAVAITGVAGPGGGTPEKPVGLVYVAVAGPSGVTTREYRLRGDREAVRHRSEALALHDLRLALEALAEA
jgi:nicotinamide-nucleotide amidase